MESNLFLSNADSDSESAPPNASANQRLSNTISSASATQKKNPKQSRLPKDSANEAMKAGKMTVALVSLFFRTPDFLDAPVLPGSMAADIVALFPTPEAAELARTSKLYVDDMVRQAGYFRSVLSSGLRESAGDIFASYRLSLESIQLIGNLKSGADRGLSNELQSLLKFPDNASYPSFAPLAFPEGIAKGDTMLKTDCLVQAAIRILWSKGGLKHNGTPSSKSNGRIWGVKEATPGLIACCYIMVYYILSPDEALDEVGSKTGVRYKNIFNNIVGQLRNTDNVKVSRWSRSLMEHFNKNVFEKFGIFPSSLMVQQTSSSNGIEDEFAGLFVGDDEEESSDNEVEAISRPTTADLEGFSNLPDSATDEEEHDEEEPQILYPSHGQPTHLSSLTSIQSTSVFGPNLLLPSSQSPSNISIVSVLATKPSKKDKSKTKSKKKAKKTEDAADDKDASSGEELTEAVPKAKKSRKKADKVGEIEGVDSTEPIVARKTRSKHTSV